MANCRLVGGPDSYVPSWVLPLPTPVPRTPVMTEQELAALLFQAGTATVSVGNAQGILQGVTREDGSGRSFLLRILCAGNEQKTVYVRIVG